MYKVFFKDRIIFLKDDIQSPDKDKDNHGSFYKYRTKEELKEVINSFLKTEKSENLSLLHNNIHDLQKEFISLFRFIKAAGGLVKNDKGQILIIKRNDIWDLPKGKNNPGESASQTAIREVSEECGISNLKIIREIIKTYHIYFVNKKAVLKETTWFEMIADKENTPRPQADENISEVRWIGNDNISLITDNTYLSVMDVIKKGIIS